MDVVRSGAADCTAAIIVVTAAIAGCGGGDSTPATSSRPAAPSASSSVARPSSGQPTDYGAVLIKPGDIGGDVTTPQPPVLNPNNAPGVAQLFANADNSRRIGVSILVVADPAAAAAGIENTKANYGSKVKGAWQPVDVGSHGTMISGVSPDGSQAVTVLLFSEGRALVNLEFDSAPSDPTDPALATDIGRKQDAAIKAGLPS